MPPYLYDFLWEKEKKKQESKNCLVTSKCANSLLSAKKTVLLGRMSSKATFHKYCYMP